MHNSRFDTTKRNHKGNYIMLVAYAIAMMFCVYVILVAVNTVNDAIQDFNQTLDDSSESP